MDMLRACSFPDADDGPHTLRSTLLCTPHDSLSLTSSSLQISQSPTEIPNTKPCDGSALDAATSAGLASPNERSHLVSEENLSKDVISSTAIQRTGQSSGMEKAESRENGHQPDNELLSQITNMSMECQTFSDQQSSKLAPDDCTASNNLNVGYIPSPDPSTNTSCSHNANICSQFEETPSKQFYSFVILHVPEDQETASRVCRVLQDLNVGKGTTFCEGFEMPGISPLTCLEHAVEDSAYIILLLTTDFLSKWGLFQANTVLMNSINDIDKQGSVIPFHPRDIKLRGKIPICIQSLIALKETSSLFERNVQNTFKQDVIRERHQIWTKNQHLLTIQKNRKKMMEHLEYLQQLQKASQGYSSNSSEQLQSEAASSLTLPLFYGQTPVIQISNVANVQIGNQNSMNVQMAPNEPQEEFAANGYFDEQNMPAN